jgi:TonB family protein
MSEALAEVFTAVELARAAGVSRALVDAAIAAGELKPLPGTRFFGTRQAVHAARRLRAIAATLPMPVEPLFSTLPGSGFRVTSAYWSARREGRTGFLLSSGVHAVVVGLLLWAATGDTPPAAATPTPDGARLVFLLTPGPGGGGGGGGRREHLPAAAIERVGRSARVTVPPVTPAPAITTASRQVDPPPPSVPPEPAVIEHQPEPIAAPAIVAPVVAAASNTQERQGVIERPQSGTSQGTGTDSGAGSGRSAGNGNGTGAGLGDGAGGGTGGGPYRPGSGIEPPRLLREVKAEYTEDARRGNVSGDVELEIVVTRDGGVSDLRVLKGLGAGLDEQAVAAVGQWRFSPARRNGLPVDVIVEVAVEFTLR